MYVFKKCVNVYNFWNRSISVIFPEPNIGGHACRVLHVLDFNKVHKNNMLFFSNVFLNLIFFLSSCEVVEKIWAHI